jgi:hypothetical protein
MIRELSLWLVLDGNAVELTGPPVGIETSRA